SVERGSIGLDPVAEQHHLIFTKKNSPPPAIAPSSRARGGATNKINGGHAARSVERGSIGLDPVAEQHHLIFTKKNSPPPAIAPSSRARGGATNKINGAHAASPFSSPGAWRSASPRP